jgi:pimeloyl-ACP methyl ester carboxylesterase
MLTSSTEPLTQQPDTNAINTQRTAMTRATSAHVSHARVPRLLALTAAMLALGLAACADDATTTASPAATAPSTATAAPAPSTTTASPAATAPSTTTSIERQGALVDELIPTDTGRMHLRCVGSGPTTVLLLAGWGDGGDSWGGIEPAIAEQARVCSYARFGTGTSDPPPTTQTFATQATDLHALLHTAGEPGPYVVLGHSFGGAEAVTFASQYADEVVGLMLLDASPVTWPATVCSVPAYEALCAAMHDPTLDPERLDVFAAFEAVATISSLGDLPKSVVTAAHRTAPSLGTDELARLDTTWAEGVERWAALSSASTITSVEETGHYIQVDQPTVVIAELVKLLP